jgi:hypothetical protein
MSISAAAAPTDTDTAEHSGMVESEVEVEMKAVAGIGDVLTQYAEYLAKNFPHVKSLKEEDVERFSSIVHSASDVEINSRWRFSVADISQWSGYDDGLLRAIMPTRCRGEAYSTLKRVINGAFIREMSEDHVDDIISFVFCNVAADTGKFNLTAIFELEKENRVELLIDSCCFNPNSRSGDELYLDVEKMSDEKAAIEKVFGAYTFTTRIKGRFEDLAASSSDDDEEEEEEIEELDEDDEEDDDDDDVAIEK